MTVLVSSQESEIARLQAKLSSTERESHHDLSRSLSGLPSASWTEASSDTSLELSESLKASVRATLEPPSSPGSGWQGLSRPDESCTTDSTFNPLTYMLDGTEPEEPELDSLSGMLRFVNQTLALQESTGKWDRTSITITHFIPIQQY